MKALGEWESLIQLSEFPVEFVERDFAGTGGHLRYTHRPSGKTLVQQPFYQLKGWCEARDAFFSNYSPDLQIVTSSLKLMGTVAQAVGFQGMER